MGEGSGGVVPPEAEENGAHAQEWEANCSLQHAKSENAARMLIAAGGHTVVYGTRGGGVGLSLFGERENQHSEIVILMSIS